MPFVNGEYASEHDISLSAFFELSNALLQLRVFEKRSTDSENRGSLARGGAGGIGVPSLPICGGAGGPLP